MDERAKGAGRRRIGYVLSQFPCYDETFILREIEALAGQGVAILVISSELPEVLRLADRILVMREGRLVAEFAHADASEESIVAAATGQREEEAA